MTAIGVLRAAYMVGMRVPQDLSVIGLDDIDFAEFTLPPLTTIRLSRIDLARAAFEALRQQAEDPTIPPCSVNSWSRRAWCCADRPPRLLPASVTNLKLALQMSCHPEQAQPVESLP